MKRVMCAVLALVLVLGLAGCGKKPKGSDEGSSGSSEVSSSSSQAEGEASSQAEGDTSSQAEDEAGSEAVSGPNDGKKEVPLISTKLSWFVPSGFVCEQTETGFLAFDENSDMAVEARKESLKVISPGFQDTDRVADDVIKSRLYDLVDTKYYTTSDYELTKVTVANQSGYVLKCNYVLEDFEGVINAFCTQFDSDLVMFVGMAPRSKKNALWDIITTVTATKAINTTWNVE